jgi:N-acetylglucosaminyldiphosphoundecaprenol N-acetyl-beta-D-mannosaminyltransferase
MLQRVNILGIGVSAIDMPTALNEIEQWIVLRKSRYVCVTGVHGVMESYRDPQLRIVHNAAGLVTPDGMPLVWMSWLMGFRHVRRVYGPDLMLALCERSTTRGYRHFIYGSTDDTLRLLSQRLCQRFKGLKIVGSYAPPFGPIGCEEEERAAGLIRAAAPDVLWVGLSTPKQERWMAEHVGRLGVPVMLGVGAAFDFHAGIKRQAPRWIGQSGLEWLFRLVTEPRRLWRRYLINNPTFLYLAMRQIMGRSSLLPGSTEL